MKDKRSIISLLIGACLFVIAFGWKEDIGNAVFYILFVLGWIAMFLTLAFQTIWKKQDDTSVEG